MAGQAYIPTNLAGGFQYTPVSYTYGQTSQSIGGGFSFSLPLDTVAAFTNSSLTFAANNSTNAQGFLNGVIGQAQGNLGAAISQANVAGPQMYQQGLAVQDNAISKFYKKSFCFITTAVTQAAGKPDDCWELQALRTFRDTVLRATPEGEALIKQYYDIAPQIVTALEAKGDKTAIYARLSSLFIYPALQAIAGGDNVKATEIYTGMVHFAAALAGVAIPDPTATPAPVVEAPTASTMDTVAAVVGEVAPIVSAVVPGAAQVVADVQEAVKLEPVFMEAIHTLGTAAASLAHLFKHED